MLRFIVKWQRYDGACLNALFTTFETIDCEVPELERALRSGGCGGGPDGDAFNRPELLNVEVLAAQPAPGDEPSPITPEMREKIGRFAAGEDAPVSPKSDK
jgi:hypothetical protein